MPVEVFRWILLGSSVLLGMMAVGGTIALRSNKTRGARQSMLAFTATCAVGCPLFLLAGLGIITLRVATYVHLPFLLWMGYAQWKHTPRMQASPQRPVAHPALAWTLIVLLYIAVAMMAFVAVIKQSGWKIWMSFVIAALLVTLGARPLLGLTKSSK